MKLREIAHARAGDKGNISNVSLIVKEDKYYNLIKEQVTAEKVKKLYGQLVLGKVTRYELPQIGALNFVMENALAGGVTRTLSLDSHGKSFSSILLNMDIGDL